MTATEEIRHHQARCQPYLLRLRMLARGEGEPALTVAEASHATDTIVIEARTATRAARADPDGGHPAPGRFCGCG